MCIITVLPKQKQEAHPDAELSRETMSCAASPQITVGLATGWSLTLSLYSFSLTGSLSFHQGWMMLYGRKLLCDSCNPCNLSGGDIGLCSIITQHILHGTSQEHITVGTLNSIIISYILNLAPYIPSCARIVLLSSTTHLKSQRQKCASPTKTSFCLALHLCIFPIREGS